MVYMSERMTPQTRGLKRGANPPVGARDEPSQFLFPHLLYTAVSLAATLLAVLREMASASLGPGPIRIPLRRGEAEMRELQFESRVIGRHFLCRVAH
jgi:hypothetical protein